MRRLRTTTKASSRNRRSGLSLLEVVLSITIFVGAVTALSQLSTNGMSAAVKGRLDTQAILRCESKLAEVSAAIEPLEDISDQAFQDDENWTWSLSTSGGPHADVLFVTVTVDYNGQSDLSSTSVSLSKLIRDPAVFEDSLEEDAP
jgi:Tfp pilus assembly protein PilV